MMYRLLILAISALSLEVDCGIQKCDRTILLGTSKKIGQLTQNEVENFLSTFGYECKDNAEFSEWSNELLFEVLDRQTEVTIKTMEKVESKIEIDVILAELSAPVNDGINLKILISKVEKIKINDQLKKEILARLKIADESMN